MTGPLSSMVVIPGNYITTQAVFPCEPDICCVLTPEECVWIVVLALAVEGPVCSLARMSHCHGCHRRRHHHYNGGNFLWPDCDAYRDMVRGLYEGPHDPGHRSSHRHNSRGQRYLWYFLIYKAMH